MTPAICMCIAFALFYLAFLNHCLTKAAYYYKIEHMINTYGTAIMPAKPKRAQHIRRVAKVESRFFSCYVVVSS